MTLCKALAACGAAASASDAAQRVFTRATLQEQYEVAMLDMGRLVFAYQWSRASFAGEMPLNRNSYNKSLKHAMWLVVRCEALLREREQRARTG